MKSKNIILLILVVIVVLMVIIFMVKNLPTQQEIQVRQIIQAFITSKGMDIKPDSEEYKIFMKKIFWGEYPELTGSESEFITNSNELDDVLRYAWKYSGFKDQYGDYVDRNEELQEAVPPSTQPKK